jgi:hypothetical protein
MNVLQVSPDACGKSSLGYLSRSAIAELTGELVSYYTKKSQSIALLVISNVVHP